MRGASFPSPFQTQSGFAALIFYTGEPPFVTADVVDA